jgi:RNA polymerase sigma factor (sigma-70 family)
MADKLLSDHEVLAALKTSGKEGDEALRFLYRSHFSYLQHYILNNQGSEDDAADIFQEVMISFMHIVQQEKFRGESSIRTFLYTLNRNLWLNELKRRGRALKREKNFGELHAAAEQGALHHMEQRQSAGQLMAIMEQLGESCKSILTQFYYEQRSMKEIVTTLHYENEQVVRNKKSKCLKKLGELLKGQAPLFEQLKNLLHE